MTSASGKTKAVNMRIEEQFEELLRETVYGIRKGGPEFRHNLTALLDDLRSTEKTEGTASHQCDLRTLERRVCALEERAEDMDH